MPRQSGKRLTLEEELRALTEVAADPRSAGAREQLGSALAGKRSLVAARAARLIKEHSLDGFDAQLAAAFDRFLGEPPKSDPSCQAKLAALEALDYAGSMDPEPFVRATRHFQYEGADTAAGLRARGVLGLARIGYSDFDLIVAKLSTDPLPPVRQAALEALAHRGDRAGAPLALVKIGIGDEDPLVTLAAMSALMTLAPGWAVDELRALLDGEAAEPRELAAVALGQSRNDDALAALLGALERCTRSEERDPLVRGIGLHRSERALDTMLAIISDGHPADAKTAVEALSPRRFEPGVAARVRRAAAQNDRVSLAALVDEVLGGA
jgi:HEAT repeat protein